MRSFCLKSCFLVFLSLTFIKSGYSQQESQCIALITGIKGNVSVKKEGKSEFTKALWGTQLFSNDEVKTDLQSQATLTFSDGNILELQPGSNIKISGNSSSASKAPGNFKKVSSAMLMDMSALTARESAKKDVGALAGLRGIEMKEPVELTFPSNTLIRTNRPTFEWTPRQPFDNYIVNLYSSKGLVWSKEVSGSRLKFPENERGLDFGETYFWNIEGEDLLDNKKSSNYKFSVLSIDKSQEVKNQEALIRMTFDNVSDSSSLHSFLGAYYLNQGLLDDAIKEFDIISRMNPDAPLPHEILGSLYSDVGNKDKAIDELQKALNLSRGKEK
jgi:hypothetical protein